MKVLGGLISITQKTGTLAKLFLVAPELARLSEEAESMLGCVKAKRQYHHELLKSAIDRQEQRVVQLKTVIEESNPFCIEGSDLMNCVTNAVMLDKVKADILQRSQKGKDAYCKFVNERIVGPVNLWEPITKMKLKTYKDRRQGS
jgi:hypothetical protein